MRHAFIKILVLTLCLLSATAGLSLPALARQGQASAFVYDEDGRLRAVLSPAGEASVYEYDAAGNITAVRRLTPNDLELLGFTPARGPVGTLVTIYGTGLDQGVNSVSFNGAAAVVVRSNMVSVAALVPENATTGPITVVTPRGSLISTKPFVVRGIRLTPEAATVTAEESLQFGLTVSGTPTGAVTWTVNDAEGGTPSLGTITAAGLYTAPSLAGETPVQFIVRATSVDDAELFGESLVTVVPFGGGSQFRSAGLSVRYGTPPNTPPAYVAGGLSVRYGTPPNSPPAEIRGAVSASRGPVLTSLTPGAVSRGAGVTLTFGGAGLTGATGVNFFNLSNGAHESGITVTNINVNAQGTSLTATVTATAGVTPGRYAVVITTPAGSTVRNDAGSNVLQVN